MSLKTVDRTTHRAMTRICVCVREKKKVRDKTTGRRAQMKHRGPTLLATFIWQNKASSLGPEDCDEQDATDEEIRLREGDRRRWMRRLLFLCSRQLAIRSAPGEQNKRELSQVSHASLKLSGRFSLIFSIFHLFSPFLGQFGLFQCQESWDTESMIQDSVSWTLKAYE